MMLTAWSEGIGSNWVGFGNLEAVGELLGVPEELDVLAIVPFGYPVDALGKGDKKHKPLAEIAHRHRALARTWCAMSALDASRPAVVGGL
jgi:nitroreductase